MSELIKNFYRPAILGATELGGKIAALFASMGLRVAVYDKPHAEDANFYAQQRFHSLLNDFPNPAISVEALHLLEARNYRDNWELLQQHDLIIDCYEDELKNKQGLWVRLAPALQKDAILISYSNTLNPIDIIEALPAGRRTHFLVANILLKQRFIELIPNQRTEPRVLKSIEHFFREKLAQNVIISSPNNFYLPQRILNFSLASAFYHQKRLNLKLSEIEELTGDLINRNQGLISFAQEYANIKNEPNLADLERFSNLYENSSAVNLDGFPLQSTEINHNLKKILFTNDWLALQKNEDIYAQFLSAYLFDSYQYFNYLQNEYSSHDLQLVQRSALAWRESSYEQMQNFRINLINKYHYESPYQIERITNSYRRNKINSNSYTFSNHAKLLRQEEDFLIWRYKERVTIWECRVEHLDLKILTSLQQTIQEANSRDDIFLLFSNINNFGKAKSWQKNEIIKILPLLQKIVLALRLQRQLVLSAFSGDIYDLGATLFIQSDYSIFDTEAFFYWQSVENQLFPPAGFIFEWLRRLPVLDDYSQQAQIGALIDIVKKSKLSILSAQRHGLLRFSDKIINKQNDFIAQTLKFLDFHLQQEQSRIPRYTQQALANKQFRELFEIRYQNDEFAQQILKLLRNSPENKTLSLSNFLKTELNFYQQN